MYNVNCFSEKGQFLANMLLVAVSAWAMVPDDHWITNCCRKLLCMEVAQICINE
jgi:hypothetical protein